MLIRIYERIPDMGSITLKVINYNYNYFTISQLQLQLQLHAFMNVINYNYNYIVKVIAITLNYCSITS